MCSAAGYSGNLASSGSSLVNTARQARNPLRLPCAIGTAPTAPCFPEKRPQLSPPTPRRRATPASSAPQALGASTPTSRTLPAPQPAFFRASPTPAQSSLVRRFPASTPDCLLSCLPLRARAAKAGCRWRAGRAQPPECANKPPPPLLLGMFASLATGWLVEATGSYSSVWLWVSFATGFVGPDRLRGESCPGLVWARRLAPTPTDPPAGGRLFGKGARLPHLPSCAPPPPQPPPAPPQCAGRSLRRRRRAVGHLHQRRAAARGVSPAPPSGRLAGGRRATQPPLTPPLGGPSARDRDAIYRCFLSLRARFNASGRRNGHWGPLEGVQTGSACFRPPNCGVRLRLQARVRRPLRFPGSARRCRAGWGGARRRGRGAERGRA